jgi:cell division protein FtsB
MPSISLHELKTRRITELYERVEKLEAENERLKRTVNRLAGGAARGLLEYAKTKPKEAPHA